MPKQLTPDERAKLNARRRKYYAARYGKPMRFVPHRGFDHAHPFVREMYDLMNFEQVSIPDATARSGLSRDWYRNIKRCMPRLDHVEAALNAVGLELVVRRRRDEADA